MEEELEPRDPESSDLLDLMGSACGIDFNAAETDIDWREIEGIKIPFASAALLLKTKQTVRDKDEIDRHYLMRILKEMPEE